MKKIKIKENHNSILSEKPSATTRLRNLIPQQRDLAIKCIKSPIKSGPLKDGHTGVGNQSPLKGVIRPNRGAATHAEKDIATLCKAYENHLGYRSRGESCADFEDKLCIRVESCVQSQYAVQGGCGGEVVYPWG